MKLIKMRLVRSKRLMSDDKFDEDCEVSQAHELDKISKMGESVLQLDRLMNEDK